MLVFGNMFWIYEVVRGFCKLLSNHERLRVDPETSMVSTA